MEEASIQVVDQIISMGTFISATERLKKVVDLDKGIILHTIEYINVVRGFESSVPRIR